MPSASVPACRFPAWIFALGPYYVGPRPESWKELCALQVVLAHGIYHSLCKQAEQPATVVIVGHRCPAFCWLPFTTVLSFCPLGGSHGLRMEVWLLGGIGRKSKEHGIRSILRQSLWRQIYEILLKFHIMLRLSSEKSEIREGRKSGREGGRVRERYLVCYLSLFCIVESFTNLMHKLINGILLSNPLWLPSLTSQTLIFPPLLPFLNTSR